MINNYEDKYKKDVDALIFLIIGPTGVGKNTLINAVLEKRDDLTYLSSYTTREMRAGEKEGSPYHFLSKENFEKMIHKGDFVEWNIVQGGNYYGVNKNYIQQKLDNKENVITDIDVLGAIDIIEYFPRETVGIFITISDRDELELRVRNRNRGESNEEIKKRLVRAKMEFSFKRHFEYIIVNDVVKDAKDELNTIIDFEIKNMKTREIYSRSDFLHYYVNIILTSGNKVLLRQKKGDPDKDKWTLPGRHILRNETPNKALSRLLKRNIYDFNEKYKGVVEWSKFATPISFKYTMVNDTHWHYQMNFRYSVENRFKLDGASYYYEWKDLSYLNIDDILPIT